MDIDPNDPAIAPYLLKPVAYYVKHPEELALLVQALLEVSVLNEMSAAPTPTAKPKCSPLH